MRGSSCVKVCSSWWKWRRNLGDEVQEWGEVSPAEELFQVHSAAKAGLLILTLIIIPN